MPSSVISAVGSAVASKALGSVLGGKKKSSGGGGQAGFVPFEAGGVYGKMKGDKFVVGNLAGRKSLIDSLSGGASNMANTVSGYIPQYSGIYKQGISDTQGLLDKLPVGYGDITKARVQSIQNQRQKSSSDLMGSLARRRVTGSSFGNDALARNDREFAQAESDARAKSYLEELNENTRLLDQKRALQLGEVNTTLELTTQAYDLRQASNQIQLDELNSHLDTARSILGNVQEIAQKNAQVEREMLTQRGEALGGISANIGNAAGGYFSSLFEPSSNVSIPSSGFSPYSLY